MKEKRSLTRKIRYNRMPLIYKITQITLYVRKKVRTNIEINTERKRVRQRQGGRE